MTSRETTDDCKRDLFFNHNYIDQDKKQKGSNNVHDPNSESEEEADDEEYINKLHQLQLQTFKISLSNIERDFIQSKSNIEQQLHTDLQTSLQYLCMITTVTIYP